MDHRSFDSLARSLATARTRRGLLGSLAALGAGLLGARGAGAQVTQAQCGNVACYNRASQSVDVACAPGCVCCVYPNGNSRCRPAGTCSPGEIHCPPGQVLGPSGVCVAPTTTTTTTPNPLQGTCAAGQDACHTLEPLTCNGSDNCKCGTHLTGATVCRRGAACVPCASDADCEIFGPEELCFTGGGECTGSCLTYCSSPCGSPAA